MKHLRHLWYLVRHKFYVVKYGIYRGAPLTRLLVHDFSKFRRDEWFGYTNYYFKAHTHHRDYAKHIEAKDAAYKLHVTRNPHHWQHWVIPELKATVYYNGRPEYAARMPMAALLEMLADWDAAGMTKHGKLDSREFYESNRKTMNLHPVTRRQVEEILGVPPQTVVLRVQRV